MLAINSKLRGCNVVSLCVEEVAPHRHGRSGTLGQNKTGQRVKFEMTEQTRQGDRQLHRGRQKRPSEFLFGDGRGRIDL
jgi:hypothetical protein